MTDNKIESILPFDARFSHYNQAKSVGLAAVVIVDGKAVFKKGYGLRNLETKQKIDYRK